MAFQEKLTVKRLTGEAYRSIVKGSVRVRTVPIVYSGALKKTDGVVDGVLVRGCVPFSLYKYMAPY